MTPIHEHGDEALRPTNQPWFCHNCGAEIYTVSAIKSHKERCKVKKLKPVSSKKMLDFERNRQAQLEASLKKFKELRK